MKVLVLHNRYRLHGGEERAVDLQLAALERAGIPHSALIRDSAGASSARAARAMLRGGEAPGEVARAVRDLGATVVHVHNMNPLFGPRALAAARAEGARVVLHLHNYRLFCSIATCFRDGEPCFRCRGRLTLPGLVLNCRGSLPESAVYTASLAIHQPSVMEAVDRFVTPSEYAAGQLDLLGLPRERVSVIPNYVPDADFVAGSAAAEGEYALCAGRLSPEKGFEDAVRASALSGVPLRIAGDGPLGQELEALRAATKAPVELLGRLDASAVRKQLAGAAMVVVPSVAGDVMPFAALEAMAAGVPVVASRSGSLPEVVGEERCVPRRDPRALASAMSELWADPHRRAADGDALIALARERFGERAYVENLRAVYALS